ncbi:MAG: hypothetical protein OXC91_08395, partial [Rhodobacteraceae bacterium]|nr:hypothetical protein [Paracoccaceae bacterium]
RQGPLMWDPTPGRWKQTGSENLAFPRSISQSLAGRTAVENLLPLTRGETIRFPRYPTTLEKTLFTGSCPRIYDEAHEPSD